jgi:hypothetical protein
MGKIEQVEDGYFEGKFGIVFSGVRDGDEYR